MTAAHILITIHDFSAGGTENIAFRLAREWLAAGRRVSILAGADDGPMQARVPEGAEVHILSPQVPRSPLSRLRLGPAMIETVRALAPDVIFIPGNFHFIRAFKQALPHIPIIAKVSNPLLPRLFPPAQQLAARALKWLIQPIDLMTFMSRELRDQDLPLIGQQACAVVQEPNMGFERPTPPRVQPDGPPHILAIGRMEPQKNLALALRAFKQLLETQEARLTVLGEGRQRAELEKLVTKLGIADRVAMPGFVPDVETHLAQASLLLLSSNFEGYPAVVVEALAADVPVVATDCSPALKSLISSPLHGIVAAKANAASLADAMAQTLDMPFSSDGVRRQTVADLEPHKSGQAYLQLFDEKVQHIRTALRHTPIRSNAAQFMASAPEARK